MNAHLEAELLHLQHCTPLQKLFHCHFARFSPLDILQLRQFVCKRTQECADPRTLVFAALSEMGPLSVFQKCSPRSWKVSSMFRKRGARGARATRCPAAVAEVLGC